MFKLMRGDMRYIYDVQQKHTYVALHNHMLDTGCWRYYVVRYNTVVKTGRASSRDQALELAEQVIRHRRWGLNTHARMLYSENL